MSGQSAGQARWRGNLVWLPLKRLALFSELLDFDDGPLSILLLLIDSNLRIKKMLKADPILQSIRGVAIKDIVQVLGGESQIENLMSPFDLLRESRVECPKNIKSQSWARLLIKEALGLHLTETEEFQICIIQLFQTADLSYANQALQLLETLFSLDEIAHFFGFNCPIFFLAEREANFGRGRIIFCWNGWLG